MKFEIQFSTVIFSIIFATFMLLLTSITPNGVEFIQGFWILFAVSLISVAAFMISEKDNCLMNIMIGFWITTLLMSVVFLGIVLFWLIYLIMLITAMEVLFWMDKAKPKDNEDRIIFTAKRKLIALVFATSGVGAFNIMVWLMKPVIEWASKNSATISTVLQAVGWWILGGIAVCLIIYMVLLINSLKYPVRRS
jgi:hypothetical protein